MYRLGLTPVRPVLYTCSLKSGEMRLYKNCINMVPDEDEPSEISNQRVAIQTAYFNNTDNWRADSLNDKQLCQTHQNVCVDVILLILNHGACNVSCDCGYRNCESWNHLARDYRSCRLLRRDLVDMLGMTSLNLCTSNVLKSTFPTYIKHSTWRVCTRWNFDSYARRSHSDYT
jgi:hypothetical protein